jgi:phage-related baseplate assembly protein
MAIVDLSQLAAPDVVEELDYETILDERKATLVSRRQSHFHKHLLSDSKRIKFRKLPAFIRLLNRFRSN